jgi:hypothetical protein
MNLRKIILTLALTGIAAGCVSTPSSRISVGKEQVKLIPETVAVRPFGLNLEISGVVEISGERYKVATYGSDCGDKHGDVKVGESYDRIKNAIYNGTTPGDRLFTDLCDKGYPKAKAYHEEKERRWNSLTPEQREAEQAQAAAAARMLLQMEGQRQDRRQQQDLIDAIRERNNINCESTRSGSTVTTNCR